MEELIKNVEKAKKFNLAGFVDYQEGQVVSVTLAAQPNTHITVFAFDKGEGIASHAAGGDALVYVIEGEAKITIDGKDNIVYGGESIVMPKGISHALHANEKFKMLLVVVK